MFLIGKIGRICLICHSSKKTYDLSITKSPQPILAGNLWLYGHIVGRLNVCEVTEVREEILRLRELSREFVLHAVFSQRLFSVIPSATYQRHLFPLMSCRFPGCYRAKIRRQGHYIKGPDICPWTYVVCTS